MTRDLIPIARSWKGVTMRLRSPLILVFLVIVGLYLGPMVAVANKGGAVSGHTGAPAVGGRTCATACHRSQVNAGPGTLSIVTPTNRFVPGSVLPVEVKLGGSIQNPRNGYQMAAYTGTTLESIVPDAWVSPDLLVSRIIADHIGHALGGNQQSSWKMYFKTPANLPAFTFYCAANDANGNDQRDPGDRIYTSSLKLSPGSVPLTLKTVPLVGTNVRLDLDAPGDGGKPYVLAASLSNAGIPIGTKVIPLGVDALLLLTVTNALPFIFQQYHGVLDSTGKASATLAVPNVASLKGVQLHHAFVVIDFNQPQAIGTVSNGLPVTIF